MNVKVGTDIVDIKRFLSSSKNGGEAFNNRLFTPFEQRTNTVEQLASIFCLKEALIKALSLSYDSWLVISTKRLDNGKLDCSFSDVKIAKSIISIDTSISHEGDLIFGVAVVII